MFPCEADPIVCRLAEVSPLLFMKSCRDNTRREGPAGTNILESAVATFLCAREQRDAHNFCVMWPVFSSSVLLCFRSARLIQRTQSPLCTNQYTSHNSHTRSDGAEKKADLNQSKALKITRL
jgi:hypothetical protein